VTKSYVSIANDSIKFDVPIGQYCKIGLRHALSVLDTDGQIEIMRMLKDFFEIIIYFSSRRTQVHEISKNKEISYYIMNGIWWNWNKVRVDNVFSYNVALNVINDNDYEDQQ